jgi:hypothetical protein
VARGTLSHAPRARQVLSEVVTWFAILGSGVLFILTAQSVDMVPPLALPPRPSPILV